MIESACSLRHYRAPTDFHKRSGVILHEHICEVLRSSFNFVRAWQLNVVFQVWATALYEFNE